MQHIRFGLSLDGERGWHARDGLGESVVGPLGMLTLLETQLGLGRRQPSQPERVVQMRECLQLARTGSRFYERSLEADEVGTAATLLGWRDLWLEHGWDSQAAHTDGRLGDMAAVEVLARSKVAPGLAQRLAAIQAALEVRTTQIESVTLLDPLAEFPKAWRRVLVKLPSTEADPPTPSADPGTMLRAVQDAVVCANRGEAPAPVAWREDGTVRIARGESTLAAAQWLALGIRKGAPDYAVVAGQAGSVLDSALVAADLPRLELGEASAFRPTLQLLPLAMRLLWDPLDIPALIQFLTHPVSPLRGRVRYPIAEKMAAAPGVGGASWDALMAKITALSGDEAESDMAAIACWVDHERFKPEDGAPLAFVFERVERLAALCRARQQVSDEARRAAWRAGHDQAMAVAGCIQALLDQGISRIARESLDRLVEQATARGTSNPLLKAEAGAGGAVRDPAALVEPFDSVCWWRLEAVPMPRRYPWSPSEIAELRAAGAELPSTRSLIERQARSWLRPVLLARKCLTLVLPPPDKEPHPVWLLVLSAMKDPVIESVERVLTADVVPGETAPVPHRSLPARRRWWQLPADTLIPWPEAASYSSLEKLLFNPSHWVLHYPARLGRSDALTAPDQSRLLGSLAHRVVEELYCQDGSAEWPEEKVLAWFDSRVDRIVREEGAVLLMPGRRSDLAAFRLRFRHSLGRLHRHLRGGGVSGIIPEKALEGSTPLGKLTGSSDLSLSFGDGRRAIIDMKWGSQGWYRDKLRNQTHLQLCIYAKLESEGRGRWPEVAYYILGDGEMLTASAGLFPAVRPLPVEDETPLLWERINATWAWRKGQIERGAIELVFDDVEPTAESEPPPGALLIETPGTRYNDFIHLAGWAG